MLIQLLSYVSGARGVMTLAEVAREMNAGMGLVETMVADAVRLGYLVSVEGTCSHERCSDCLLDSSCGPGGATGYWLLTEKGKRFLAHRAATNPPG